MIRILTSDFKNYEKKDGVKITHPMSNENGIVDLLKTVLKETKKVVFVASDINSTPDSVESYARIFFDSILDDYILTDNDGKSVSTGEKRIYTPLLIFVKNGKIIAHHTDTVDSQTDPYVALNDRQSEELLLKLINYMSKISASVCDESC